MNTRFIYFWRYGLLVTILAVGFVLTNSAWGQVKGAPVERKAWNVEEMQALTDQLVTEMSAARQAARREPLLQEAQRGGVAPAHEVHGEYAPVGGGLKAVGVSRSERWRIRTESGNRAEVRSPPSGQRGSGSEAEYL